MPGDRPDPLPIEWKARVLEGNLVGVDPRLDLPRLRLLVEEAVAEGRDVVPFFKALSRADALAMMELVVGPRAVPGGPVLDAAMEVIDILEKLMAPASLYRRLLALAGPRGADVLRLAASRHPEASWLVHFSDVVPEAGVAGLIHLMQTASHPSFAGICWAHAAAGHHIALEEVAGQTGRPEPVAALLSVGVIHAARRAAARALESAPDAAVVPWVAAVWGPDLDVFFAGTVPLVKDPRAALALLACSRGWTRTRALLKDAFPNLDV